MWLALHGRLPKKVFLSTQSVTLADESLCDVCEEPEIQELLFLHCHKAYGIWIKVPKIFRIHFATPATTIMFFISNRLLFMDSCNRDFVLGCASC